MTKEELEKEATEYVCKRNPFVTKEWFIDAFKKYDKGEKVKYLKDCEIAEYEAYIAGAEPREKQIQIDAEQIRALQKDKGELTDRVRELETSVSNLRKDNKELREVLPKLDKENDELKYQLTKAKEIIRKLLFVYTSYADSFDDRDNEIVEEAEQFLKGQSSTEPSNECHDCAKLDEMPNGPRCKTCDNGSRFQKKEEA